MAAYTPPRCRLCADALAECSDVSVGDTWLDRFTDDPAVADGVSDVIARTPAGERLVGELMADRLSLMPATPDEIIASQAEAVRIKRQVLRGKLWLRRRAGRAVPDYPGLDLEPSAADRLAGLRDLAEETLFRAVGDLRYP